MKKGERISWPKKPAVVRAEDTTALLQMKMRQYGQEKARTVRTARRFLRTVGLEIASDGKIEFK